MQNRKPPFVHCARSPEQTSAPVQVSAGKILTRLRERFTGGNADADMPAPADTNWDAER